jgi:F-type H+-transporting ATPase subunit b
MFLLATFAEGSIQLVPDGSIFIHIVLVLVMIAVLNRTLFAPIFKVLSEREQRGKGNLAQAIEIETKVEQGNREYREALRSARTAGYKSMQEKRALDLQARERELEAVRREVESRVMSEREAIDRQAAAAREQVDPMSLGKAIRDRVFQPLENSGK